jgi:flagellar biosynthesis/type III secretory pathway protein FliH
MRQVAKGIDEAFEGGCRDDIKDGSDDRESLDFDEGLEEGFEDGLEEGFKDALEEGFKDGLEEGFEDSFSEGIKDGSDGGLSLGVALVEALQRVGRRQ